MNPMCDSRLELFQDIYAFLDTSSAPQTVLDYRLPEPVREQIQALLQANKERALSADEIAILDEYERLEHRLRMKKIAAYAG